MSSSNFLNRCSLAKPSRLFFLISLVLSTLALTSCSKEERATATGENANTQQQNQPSAKESKLDLNAPLPVDEKFRIGKLKNGLTYYIRQNNLPENRVNLSLAVNAGSVLENESQLGLAHFVEHMAFNGTKHFEKNELTDFLESLGAGFGSDINAYTSFDETVYQLDLPDNTDETINTGLLVLQDWAAGITFAKEEIEKERGVIDSEREARLGAQQRMLETLLPKLTNNSLYSQRLPIGKREVFMTASRETFLEFYQTWYRPDSIAVIAVGQFDLDDMEEKIKAKFAELKNPETPRPQIDNRISFADKKQFIHLADKEQPQRSISLTRIKLQPPAKNLGEMRSQLIDQLMSSMLNKRFAKLAKKADTPFFNAAFMGGSIFRHYQWQSIDANVKENNLEASFKAIVREAERAKKYGFVEAELQREKQNFINYIENSYKERDKTESSAYISAATEHYLAQQSLMSAEQTLNVYSEFLNNIKLAEVNQQAKKFFNTEKFDVFLWEPEASKSKVDLATIDNWAAEVTSQSIAAYQEEATSDTLMKTPPKAKATALKVQSNDKLGTTELLYANNIRVVLKPTTFKNDEIQLSAFRAGGSSLYPDKDYLEADMTASIAAQSGVGEFNANQLQNFMSDKKFNVYFSINNLYEDIRARSNNKDLQNMLQMIHLKFTQPRFEKDAAQISMENLKQQLAMTETSPDAYLNSQFQPLTYSNHFRTQLPTVESIDSFDFERAKAIYQERFADANDFTFVFTGSFKTDEIRPLIDQYIATLPQSNSKSKSAWKDTRVRPTKGVVREDLQKGETQKSTLLMHFNYKAPYSQLQAQQHRFVHESLSKRLMETLREEMGSTYSPRAGGYINQQPENYYHIYLSVSSNPKDLNKLVDAALVEVKKLKAEGPDEESFHETKQVLLKGMEKSMKTNSFWHSNLVNAYRYGNDPEDIVKTTEIIENISREDVKKAANQYLNTDWYTTITLSPEK